MKLLGKLCAFFRKRKLDAELAEEMRYHVELQTEQHIAAGMNPDEARYAVLRQVGPFPLYLGTGEGVERAVFGGRNCVRSFALRSERWASL